MTSLDPDLPRLVLHDEALRHNIATMAAWCDEAGVLLAPHAKTSMSSYIADLQAGAGAWGQTVATIRHAKVVRGWGVDRLLLANVLVEPAGIAWVAHTFLQDGSEGELLCYVDSLAGVQLLQEQLARWSPARSLGVLVELGHPGGRTGARRVEEAVAVADAVRRSPPLHLRGVAAFEGLLPLEGPGHTVRMLLDDLATLTRAVHDHDGFIVSAGGSSWFDLVADLLAPDALGLPVTTILRSGCYATHDHGIYRRTSPFDGRAGASGPRFLPALELQAAVWSLPEPGLAIVGFGRRDAPIDDQLPVVLGLAAEDGTTRAPAAATVVKVNDQHAYLEVDPAHDWRLGDVVSLGISHPCGAFDRWRSIPVVDAAGRITTVVEPRL